MKIHMPASHRRTTQRGQIIVIFALGLVALVAMVGLVLDGGSAFAQRRFQQNAADLAALAGANHYLVNSDMTSATATARSTAADNGFTHGAGGTSITTAFDFSRGVEVTVDIASPHRNNFIGVVGMPTWEVATTATAQAGIPDGANGAAPFQFNIEIFGPDGQPSALYSNPAAPFGFNADNDDAPTSAGDLAWTDFSYDTICEDPGNVDASTVMDIITADLLINTTVPYGCYVGQHNNGEMTTVYDDVDDLMVGKEYSVPVVDDGGVFQGWATFHVTSAVGGSQKKVYGYFVSPYANDSLTVGCPDGTCPRYLGQFSVKLID